MAKHLIVNADDLGISIATNLAIQQAFRQGLVTSASLMANMPAFDHAVEQTLPANPRLGVGIHLCLTSGRPVCAASEVPLLVDAEGRFRRGFLGLLCLVHSRRRQDALAEIQRELHAQAARIDAAGVSVDHVDSHHHVHAIPGLFPIAVSIARSRRLAIRIPDEAFPIGRGSLAGLPRRLARGGLVKKAILSLFSWRVRPAAAEAARADAYFGILDSGKMTQSAWRSILPLLGDGVAEVNLHPGFPGQVARSLECSRQDALFLRSADRTAELQAVTDPALRAEAARIGIRTVRFADVFHSNPARPVCA